MRKSIHDLFREYLLECEFARKTRPETLRGYEQSFKTFVKLVPDVTIETLTSATITRFFRILEERKRIGPNGTIKTGIKKSSIRTYWSKMNNFFEWLRVQKYIKVNPMREMKRPTVVYEDKKFLSKQQIEKIITAVHNHSNNDLFLLKRNLAIIYTFLFCGLRREELLSLQIRDIDLERKILTVRAENSKIPRTRKIPLHSQVVMYLKDYLKERKGYTTPYVFNSKRRDDRLSSDGIKQLIDKIKEGSHVCFHLHQFRHTFAVNFLKTSNNVVMLKQLMGHTNIQMTMSYLRCLPTNELRADVENMRIDDFV